MRKNTSELQSMRKVYIKIHMRNKIYNKKIYKRRQISVVEERVEEITKRSEFFVFTILNNEVVEVYKLTSK